MHHQDNYTETLSSAEADLILGTFQQHCVCTLKT